MGNSLKWLLKASSTLLLSVFIAHAARGQEFSIASGSISTCAGVIEDTGLSSGPYGNNEDHTVTICADNPGMQSR